MSLVHLSHVCSHLQNASRARLGTTSIPLSNMHLGLAHQLHKAGFIGSVCIGGLTAPPPADPLLQYQPVGGGAQTEGGAVAEAGAEAGAGAGAEEHVVTQANVATRRLWLGLKYWNNKPVIERMAMVSKPTRRIWLGVKDLAQIARGTEAGYVKGLRGVGECLFVSTDRGVMEVRECVERGVGGQVLCRVL